VTPEIRDALGRRIVKEEGERRLLNGNHALYRDSKNFVTIAHGYNIEVNGLPDDIARELFRRSLAGAEIDAEKVPGYAAADSVRQSVVVAMVYQMGLHTVLSFKRFCIDMAAGAYGAAADEMLDSDWYRHDSPARAKRESDIMRIGAIL